MASHVIYARKSTESEDRQILSIDSQIQELKTLALHRGIAVSEVLTEAHSAKAPGRAVFGQLMRRVSRGEVHGIICWKMDRLARNHFDTGTILQALADGKLQEVITSDRTYTRDGNDRFMGNFELGMATKYIDDLRANVRRGNRARFARGWVNHNPPLGYLLDPVSKTIVKDPERFDLVRRIWELVLTAAMLPSQIRRVANDQWGLRTRQFKRVGGNPVARVTFYKMLANPFYMGLIRLQTGETFAGAHPPMVTREEFGRVQEILGRPGRARPKRHEFPFTGLIRCGGCGGSITAEEHIKRSGRRYVYYHCSRHKSGVQCREPAIPAPELETQIWRSLQGITVPPRVLSWLLDRVARVLHAEDDRRSQVRETLEKTLGDVRRESENLLSLRLRDLITDDVYVARKAELDSRMGDLETKLSAPSRSEEEVVRLTADMFRFASRAAQVFQTGSGVQKRMVLETVGLNYTLSGRKVAFSLKNPFSIIAKSRSSSDWWTCPDDVRTWIEDAGVPFQLPELALATMS